MTTNSFIRQLEVLRIKLSSEQQKAVQKQFKHGENDTETNVRRLKEQFNKWERMNMKN